MAVGRKGFGKEKEMKGMDEGIYRVQNSEGKEGREI